MDKSRTVAISLQWFTEWGINRAELRCYSRSHLRLWVSIGGNECCPTQTIFSEREYSRFTNVSYYIFQKEETQVKTRYAQNVNSMLQCEYNSVYFVCRKLHQHIDNVNHNHRNCSDSNGAQEQENWMEYAVYILLMRRICWILKSCYIFKYTLSFLYYYYYLVSTTV